MIRNEEENFVSDRQTSQILKKLRKEPVTLKWQKINYKIELKKYGLFQFLQHKSRREMKTLLIDVSGM